MGAFGPAVVVLAGPSQMGAPKRPPGRPSRAQKGPSTGRGPPEARLRFGADERGSGASGLRAPADEEWGAPTSSQS
eukprot:scaffold1410_cov386-Prasinococcus_capsulatus_cf.AAC.22